MKLHDENLVKTAMVVGFTLVVLFPLLLTQQKINWVSFIGTGEIGDTIGGITAPIVGLLGAYLVYVSFKAQIAANRIQSSQANFSTIYSFTKEVKGIIDKIAIDCQEGDKVREVKGIEAIDCLIRVLEGNREIDLDYNDSALKNAEYLAIQICGVVGLIEESKLTSVQRSILIIEIKHWFVENLADAFLRLSVNSRALSKLKGSNTFKKAFEIMENLNN